MRIRIFFPASQISHFDVICDSIKIMNGNKQMATIMNGIDDILITSEGEVFHLKPDLGDLIMTMNKGIKIEDAIIEQTEKKDE
jgi:biotin synthase-like enzyme